jgi:hypothetical protein
MKLLRDASLTAGVLLLIPCVAKAQSIPRADVDRQCAERSRGLNSMNPDRNAISPAAKNLCIEREQEAYDELKMLWPRYDPDLKERCLQGSRWYVNYEGILNCLIAAEPIQESRRPSHFRY